MFRRSPSHNPGWRKETPGEERQVNDPRLVSLELGAEKDHHQWLALIERTVMIIVDRRLVYLETRVDRR